MKAINQKPAVRLAGLTTESVVDGQGLRLVLWAQGCRHRCPQCHSPFTWEFEGGRLYQAADLLTEIRKNPILRGVTFSGGDPMEQAGAFAHLARQVRGLGLDIWCYTGYTWEQLQMKSRTHRGIGDLLRLTDVLVDGRFEYAARDTTLAFRGSANQRLIDAAASLKQNRVVLFCCD